MPKLREVLDDNFEGSAFVGKQFKKNPLLSILGLPLLVVELLLLPVRLITNRKDEKTGALKELYESSPQDPREGFGLTRQRSHGSPYRSPYYNMQMVSPDQDFVDDIRRMMESEHTRSKRDNKRTSESVLFPGWRLPHRETRSKPSRSSRRRRDRSSSAYESSDRNRSRASRAQSVHSASDPDRFSEQFQGQPPSSQSVPLQYGQAPFEQAEDLLNHGEQTPRLEASNNYAPFPANPRPPTVTSDHSRSERQGSQRTQPNHVSSSRTSHSSRNRSAPSASGVNYDDEESEDYAEQGPISGVERWMNNLPDSRMSPPASTHTYRTYKPTMRDDSVAPSDRGSVQSVPRDAQVSYGEPFFEEIPAERSEAPSRRSRRSTSDRGSASENHSSDGRRGRVPPWTPGAPLPPRSPSRSTTNTADLPDTINGKSRPASRAPRGQSSRTASTRSSYPEPIIEEPDSDSASRDTSRGGQYAQTPSGQYAPAMPGLMPGMQTQDFGMRQSRHSSRYSRSSREGHSGSRSRRQR